jgi:hypothetical protein
LQKAVARPDCEQPTKTFFRLINKSQSTGKKKRGSFIRLLSWNIGKLKDRVKNDSPFLISRVNSDSSSGMMILQNGEDASGPFSGIRKEE